MALTGDVRYSVRALLRTPAATFALIASAGIGIGANAVVFGFIGHLVDPVVAMPGDASPELQARLDVIGTLLTLVAVFVFAIAAASVAGLLLSRGAARVHETSVRVALGAQGRELLRPLFAEGLVVAVASIAAGLLAAFWMVHGLPSIFYEGDVEALPFVVDWRGLILATIGGALLTCAGALAPLAWTSRRRPAPDSRGTGPGLANTFGGWRSALVVLQLTLCGVLLMSTGVVADRLRAALQTDHAERTGNAIIIAVEPSGRRFEPASLLSYIETLRDSLGDTALLHALPGGAAAEVSYRIDVPPEGWTPASSLTSTFDAMAFRGGRVSTLEGRMFGGQDHPGSCPAVVVNEAFAQAHFEGDAVGRVLVSTAGSATEVVGILRDGAPPHVWVYGPQGLRADGYAGREAWTVPSPIGVRDVEAFRTNVIDGAHLDLVGLTLVAGRSLERRDTLDACGVALVNEEAAALIGGTGALGVAVVDPDGRRSEIVGVVREAPYRTLQPKPRPTIYFPYRQQLRSVMHVVVSPTDGPLSRTRATATTAMAGIRGGQITNVTTMQDHLQRTSTDADRLVIIVVQVFAGLAVMLSLIGVTGVAGDVVARRTPEIALRLALGAPRWRIVSSVMAYGVRLALVGSTMGVLVSVAAFRFVEPLPDGTRGPALLIWFAAPSALMLLVVVGALLPARRALAVDPALLLRE